MRALLRRRLVQHGRSNDAGLLRCRRARSKRQKHRRCDHKGAQTLCVGSHVDSCHRSASISAEGEGVGVNTGIEKADLKSPLADWAGLANELVEALLTG